MSESYISQKYHIFTTIKRPQSRQKSLRMTFAALLYCFYHTTVGVHVSQGVVDYILTAYTNWRKFLI